MEEYLLQGPPAYKRPRLVDSLQASANFLGFPAMSSQFHPPSSTTSSAEVNNIRPINMQQNYGLNSFGEPAVTATQPHSQPGIAHSATSVNLFSDDAVGGSMRIPVTSSIGSARPQFEAFNSRQPGPRPMVHDQVPGSSIPIGFPGDSSQFMPNPEQLLAPNILHSMNALMASPVGQFMPSSAVGSQQRFGLNDIAQNVLSENSSIINSRLQSKEWHKSVTFNIRNRLIRKMAQILSMCPDTQTGSLDNRMHNCISIATSVENETYRTANSMTQYYDLMAKRCHFISHKERGNSTQPGTQYYNLQDIRQTYEALGIAYPMGPAPYPANGGPNNNVGGGGNGGPNNNASGGGGMRLHAGEATQPPPPPPGVMPGLMGAAGGPMPYCFAGRGQPAAAVQPPGGHNQPLLGADEEATIEQLAQHAYKACQAEDTVQRDIVVVEHWDRCASQDCPTCQRSLAATTTSLNNPMNVNPVFMPRRPHRGGGGGGGSSYPSTATSGLLGNQSSQPSPGGPGGGGSIPPVGSGRSGERIPQRSTSMWHSTYNDSQGGWRSIGGPDMPMDGGGGGGGGGRRIQQRFWLPNRNPGNRHERRTPYNNPWSAPEIIFVENSRGGGQPPRGTALFGPIGSMRNMERLHTGPYGVPWRSPDVLLVENIRPAHRQPQDSDEPVIIPPEEDATPTEHQQMMAIVKVVKTHGGRLEQKYRCSRRSCSASWPCLHRRLAASIQSHKTPIPG